LSQEAVMNAGQPGKEGTKPIILSMHDEEILKAIHFYRYMTAIDVAYRLFKPSVLTKVRSLLTRLSGGGDEINNQYLYRFQLPQTKPGNKERIFRTCTRIKPLVFAGFGVRRAAVR
jgi:hypothetical protein